MTVAGDTVLAVIYVFSGTIYTITPEFSGRVNATGIDGYKRHLFEHPFLLMAFEFLGQALCLILWYIITGGRAPPRRNLHGVRDEDDEDRVEENPQINADDEELINPNQQNDGAGGHDGDDDSMLGDEEEEEPVQQYNNPAWNQAPVDQTRFNVLLFVVPALFDLARYGLLYIAIKLTYNSSYMLIRTAAVLFTVLLRVAFLSKHMAKYMWVSIGMVFVGLGLIGMTDFIYKTPEGYDPFGIAAGCLLLVMSQIMIAMQIVFEEKFMDKHSIHPLRVVGLQGCYGALVAVVLLLPFSFVSGGPFSTLKDGHLVDIKDAFYQMRGSWIIPICVVGRIVSKPIFFYTGTHFVRNQHDAAKRITIDVHHDLIIWVIFCIIGWQNYYFPQIFGFLLVPLGMLVYCDVLPLPAIFRPPAVPPPAGPLPEAERVELQDQEGGGNHDQGEGLGEGQGLGQRGGEEGRCGGDVHMEMPVAAP